MPCVIPLNKHDFNKIDKPIDRCQCVSVVVVVDDVDVVFRRTLSLYISQMDMKHITRTLTTSFTSVCFDILYRSIYATLIDLSSLIMLKCCIPLNIQIDSFCLGKCNQPVI